MMVQNIISFIPLILILTINVLSYGFFYGLLWSWGSSIVAASLVFIVVRYVFKSNLLNKVSVTLKGKVEQNGFTYVLLARIFPFFPTSLVNIGCGVTTIKYKDFLLATGLGNLVYFFVLSAVPFGILKGDPTFLLVILIAVIITFLMIRKFRRKSPTTVKNLAE
ncbi:TVP38/TMEM64 family protein [Anaerobacillus alkaliphilus]|nr:VTT domain-containing protein [Anaerobacillus alkaliphilus]